jgi:gliding motility-associated-like protein
MNPFFKIAFILLLSSGLKAQVPTATIVAPSPTLCSGVNYTFIARSTNSPTTYSWSVAPSTSLVLTPVNTSPFVILNFGRAGIYLVSLEVSNTTSTTVTTRTFNVTQSAHASFNASLNAVGYPTQMVLTNFSTYTVSNTWNYSDAVSDNSIHALKDYTASGNYSINLVAYGNKGCNDTAYYSFRIADSSGITLPNIFTPNNDSINDIYKPVSRGISKMTAFIYNRFGTLIYSWDKVAGYWDGYTSSGEPCQSGVYFCVLEGTGFDGKTYKLKSKVTLLR